MRTTKALLAVAVLGLATGAATAQSIRMDREAGFRSSSAAMTAAEMSRASARHARCMHASLLSRPRLPVAFVAVRGPAWVADAKAHFQWCRYVPRRKIAEEQRSRADELQRCFDKLGDFDDDDRGRRR